MSSVYAPQYAVPQYACDKDANSAAQGVALVAFFITTLLLLYGVYWYDASIAFIAFLFVIPIVLAGCFWQSPPPARIAYQYSAPYTPSRQPVHNYYARAAGGSMHLVQWVPSPSGYFMRILA